MIVDLNSLRAAIDSQIKVIPNNTPNRTQASDVKQLFTNILDTVEDLVNKLGLLLNQNISNSKADILQNVVLNSVITNYARKTDIPDISNLALKTDIKTYDLSIYQKLSDNIPYSRLINVPAIFSGSYLDLTNKPVIPTYDLSIYRRNDTAIDYSTLTSKPTIITSYTQLTDKPNIPNYDLSLYKLKSDTIDYTQLVNKPNMSKLLWNQTSPISYLNSTTETNVLVAANGNGTLNIEANPSIGTTYRFTGRGLFNTQTVTSPSLAIKLYLGNTIIATGSVSSLLLGASNRPLSFYIDMIVAGTNSVYTQGSMTYFGSVTDILSAAPITNNGSNATVDLSVVNQLKMTLTWSIANTANQIQMKIISLEKLNN